MQRRRTLAEVSLRLFGTPSLDIDGQPAQLGRRKAMALLSYLAVTRSRHHREALATLLWPESSAEASYSALRNVLWILRQTPLAHLLRSDRTAVELTEDESLSVDVLRFRDLTFGCPGKEHARTEACPKCVGALEEAISLAETPFMDGFLVSNAEGFDDWQFAEREALQRELTETLDRMTAFYAEAGDWADVETHARRWLRADRLNESCWRRLMHALASLGQRGEALRCFEECRRSLQEELGLEPDGATRALADRIRLTGAGTGELSEGARRTNLPSPLAPFVGRCRLIGEATDLLANGESRLVTLVGLGGIGKTSLALEIARKLENTMDDGVFFIPLAAAGGLEAVASAIARALGVPLARSEGSRLTLELEDYLREREVLLVLDEVEGVESIDRLISSLLRAAPRMRCLLTSRIPLSIGGETTIPLHGLEYPGEDTAATSLGDYDAIRLLKVAERRVDAAPATRESELCAMARVARLLDGFPLGLEMAGAWRGVFSWQEIGDRISSSLDFLVHTHRDVPERHRNLRAVYEQAWSLLTREERGTLRRLAIFEGGFSIVAAERVADCSPAVLASLARRCLIRRVAPERYHVHELLRQFSLHNLRSSRRDFDLTVKNHGTCFVEFVEESFVKLKGREQIETLRRMRLELPNIRLAWLGAAARGRADLLARATHGLFFYFDIAGHFEEGARFFRDAIERFDSESDAAVAGLLRVAYGWFTQFTAEAEPRQWFGEGIELLDSVEPFTVDHALANVIAEYAGWSADTERARERLGRSLSWYRSADDTWGEALTIAALAGAEFGVDANEGIRLAEESLKLRKKIGDRWGEALILSGLAHYAEAEENWDLAKVRYHQSQRISARISEDLFMAITAQLGRARVARKLGEFAEGLELAEDALQRSRNLSSRLLIAWSLTELGSLAQAEGDSDSARSRYEEAFDLLDGTPWRAGAGHCARLLADVAAEAGDKTEARRWRQEAAILCPKGKEKDG